ncbi:MAG TPA: phosphoribosylglycinamide formyltransferase [Streptosporangiaceae bacterium]|nr:phosphoribosylglycinamide formyltransferase [Streptosporangiaceae bacterium]
MRSRLVVLVSGSGTNLQALLDACARPDYPAQVVAVGADRKGIEGLARAERAGIPAFTHRVADYPSRDAWDEALTRSCGEYHPDLVVSAGFMKLLGPRFLATFGGRAINTHPSLLPSFAGMHGVAEALAYGVRVTGCTVFLLDEGTDSGPVVAQAAVPVHDGDDEGSLHERIKVAERALLVDTVGRMVAHGWTVEGRKVRVGSSEREGRGAAWTEERSDEGRERLRRPGSERETQ